MCALHEWTSKQYVHWCIQNTKGLCWVNIDVCSRTETCNLIEDSRLVKGSRCVHSVSTETHCSQRAKLVQNYSIVWWSLGIWSTMRKSLHDMALCNSKYLLASTCHRANACCHLPTQIICMDWFPECSIVLQVIFAENVPSVAWNDIFFGALLQTK